MQNPFDIFEKKLNNIESLLINLNSAKESKIAIQQTLGKIPILDIFDKKLLSKPTLYKHVKAGTIKLYKLGGRSYVDAEEFNNCFRDVKIS